MKEECEKFWRQKRYDEFRTAFSHINDKSYRDIFTPYRNEVFKNICEYGFIDDLKKLNCNGIYNLSIELESIKDLGTSKADYVCYIKDISRFLKENIKDFEVSNKRMYQVCNLIDSMNGFCNNLEQDEMFIHKD